MEGSLPEVQKGTSFWWFIPLARANVNGRDNTRVIQPPNIFELDQPVLPIHLGEGIAQFTFHVLSLRKPLKYNDGSNPRCPVAREGESTPFRFFLPPFAFGPPPAATKCGVSSTDSFSCASPFQVY